MLIAHMSPYTGLITIFNVAQRTGIFISSMNVLDMIIKSYTILKLFVTI